MAIITSLLLSLLLTASSMLDEGEKLFLENKPQEAEIMLKEALLENPENEKIYLYLAIIYEQLEDPQEAIRILKSGLNVAEEYKHLFYLNLGNNLFGQEEYSLAEEMFTEAVNIDGKLESAYLNRANSRLKLEKMEGALADYIFYLRIAPNSPQREEIEKLIALLKAFLTTEESRKQDEIQRQKDLLNQVLNSLQNSSEDTRNLSADSEQIEEEYDEIDIED